MGRKKRWKWGVAGIVAYAGAIAMLVSKVLRSIAERAARHSRLEPEDAAAITRMEGEGGHQVVSAAQLEGKGSTP